MNHEVAFLEKEQDQNHGIPVSQKLQTPALNSSLERNRKGIIPCFKR